MSNSGQNFLSYLDTLPASARADLFHFIESSACRAVSDEESYLLDVLALHRNRRHKSADGRQDKAGAMDAPAGKEPA